MCLLAGVSGVGAEGEEEQQQQPQLLPTATHLLGLAAAVQQEVSMRACEPLCV
jgi:hypothetical protein